MNAHLFILVAWFTFGVVCALGLMWYMKTHEKQLIDEIPEPPVENDEEPDPGQRGHDEQHEVIDPQPPHWQAPDEEFSGVDEDH